MCADQPAVRKLLAPLLRESRREQPPAKRQSHILGNLEHFNRLAAPQLLPLGCPVREAVVRQFQRREALGVKRLDVSARGDERGHHLPSLAAVHRRRRGFEGASMKRCK